MTMGLVILGIITVSLFFPFGRKAFGGMKITAPWAFLIVACFAVGVIVPNISIGATFTMSVSGFLFPAIIMLLPALFVKGGAGRAIIAEIAVTAVTTLFAVVVPVSTAGWQVLWAIAAGVSVGALAFMIARTPLQSVYAVSGGIVLGNIAFAFIEFYAYGAPVFTLGQSWFCNAFFIAVAVSLAACELAVSLTHTVNNRAASRRGLRFEASEDRDFDEVVGEDEDIF